MSCFMRKGSQGIVLSILRKQRCCSEARLPTDRCTVTVTMQLIFVFVFAYAKSRVSHDRAHIQFNIVAHLSLLLIASIIM